MSLGMLLNSSRYIQRGHMLEWGLFEKVKNNGKTHAYKKDPCHPHDNCKKYIAAVVDIVVQLKRGEKGRRYISEVYFKDAE